MSNSPIIQAPDGSKFMLLIDSDGAGHYWYVRQYENGDVDVIENGFRSLRAVRKALARTVFELQDFGYTLVA